MKESNADHYIPQGPQGQGNEGGGGPGMSTGLAGGTYCAQGGWSDEDASAKTAFFEAQVNSGIDGMLVVDSEMKVVLQNQRFIDMFQIPKEIAANTDHRERLKWITGVTANPEQFLERATYLYTHPQEISRDELELKHGRILDRYTAPLIGKNGKYYGRIWSFRDITERKRNETELRFFRKLIDRSSDWIHVVDPVTARFLDVNESGLRALGYTLAEIREMTVFDVAVGLTRSMFDSNTQRSKAAGRATAEVTHRRKDGTTYLSEVNISIATMDRDYLVVFVRDITQRKQAEAQILLQSAALEAAANGIVITDGEGTIQWANRAFTTMAGYTVEEALGKKPSILKSGIQDDAFYKNLWETVKAGRIWKGELINRRKDGTLYTEEMTITSIHNGAGELSHLIAVKQDITERKALESKLIDISRAAGMAEVATGVLHNVGNVLNSVNVSANLLQENVRAIPVENLNRLVELLRGQGSNLGSFFANDPRAPKILDFLAGAADMLGGLQRTQLEEVASLQNNTNHIKNIVAMQQSYARMAGLSESVKVADLVEDTIRINLGSLEKQAVRVVRQFDPDTPMIVAEKHKVLQILINLMSNARWACNKSAGGGKEIVVRVRHSGEVVRVEVIDNGVGIQPENLARIFNHGFTTKKEGHGFGLHNSANTAKELGGSLTAHSDGPECGATFVLELPVKRGE